MRILFVNNVYPPAAVGGYEQICADAASVLGQRGHQVTALTSAFRASDTPHDPDVVRDLKLNNNLGFDDEDPDWVCLSRGALDRHNGATIRRVIKDARIEHVVFWNGGALGWRLHREAATLCPVTYYLIDPWLARLGARRVESLRHHSGNVVRRLFGGAAKELRPGRLLFCSRSLADDYARLGFPARGGTVLYPGIPTEMFPLRPQRRRAGTPPQPPTVLYAGRVNVDKGVNTLVRAVAELVHENSDRCRLVIRGPIQGEEYEAELNRLIADLHVDSAINLQPLVVRTAMPPVYLAADVAVFPSEWREPFGLSLVEAMATGLPVVSSLSGGPAEIVRDRENAVAFQAGDAGDLAAKLAWVLDHPDEAAEIGRRASADVRARFDVRRMTAELEDYITAP